MFTIINSVISATWSLLLTVLLMQHGRYYQQRYQCTAVTITNSVIYATWSLLLMVLSMQHDHCY